VYKIYIYGKVKIKESWLYMVVVGNRVEYSCHATIKLSKNAVNCREKLKTFTTFGHISKFEVIWRKGGGVLMGKVCLYLR